MISGFPNRFYNYTPVSKYKETASYIQLISRSTLITI